MCVCVCVCVCVVCVFLREKESKGKYWFVHIFKCSGIQFHLFCPSHGIMPCYYARHGQDMHMHKTYYARHGLWLPASLKIPGYRDIMFRDVDLGV